MSKVIYVAVLCIVTMQSNSFNTIIIARSDLQSIHNTNDQQYIHTICKRQTLYAQ